MDQIVCAIVTPFVELLMVPVKKHLRYLIFCTKHVTKMHIKMEKLKTTRLGVEGDMNYNKSNSLEVPKEVEAWLKEVGMIDAQVETIPIDVGSCFNFNVRHKLGRKAFKIIQDIDRLMDEKSSINWTNNPIPLAEVDSTKASTSTPFSDYNDFRSRKEIYMKAYNALKADNKPHMIALWGMGGVGKTTMMEKLNKVVREDKLFDFIIKVAIGENMDVSVFQECPKLFRSIAPSLLSLMCCNSSRLSLSLSLSATTSATPTTLSPIRCNSGDSQNPNLHLPPDETCIFFPRFEAWCCRFEGLVGRRRVED